MKRITSNKRFDQFRAEFSPLLMKKIYPGDPSDIKYLLTTTKDEKYIESSYPDLIEKFKPYLIITPQIREVMYESQREFWRNEKSARKYLSIFEIETENDESDYFDFSENYYDFDDYFENYGCYEDFEEDEDENEKNIEILHHAMNTLNPTVRNRIFDHFVNGKSYREIAKDEGKSAMTIFESIQTGLKKLRSFFGIENTDSNKK